MSEVSDPLPRRADAQANRAALLGAAAKLYAARGLSVSYEEIAECAGVGRATLYRHFPTRDDLLTGLLDAVIRDLEAAAGKVRGRPDGIFALLEHVSRTQRRHLPIVDIVNQALNADQLEFAHTRFLALLTDPVALAQDAGLIRADLSVEDVRLLLIMVSSLTRKTITNEGRARGAALVRAMLSGGAEIPAPS